MTVANQIVYAAMQPGTQKPAECHQTLPSTCMILKVIRIGLVLSDFSPCLEKLEADLNEISVRRGHRMGFLNVLRVNLAIFGEVFFSVTHYLE